MVELPGEKLFNSCMKMPSGKRVVKLNLKPLAVAVPVLAILVSVAIVAIFAPLAGAGLAHACAVCFGADPKSPWAASINSGIFVLLGVTGLVLGWFVAIILTIRHRTRRWEARKQSLRT